MSRNSLKSVCRLIQSIKEEAPIEKQFVEDLKRSIELNDKKESRKPSQTYKPSSMNCLRNMYYQRIGIEPESESNAVLIGICESGTDRHETIQNYIRRMKYNNIDCEWINVGDYLREQNITDPVVLEQKGNETKLFSNIYNMRFMCDGLIKYKGEYYIIEIKTESTHKFNRHEEPWPSHIQQATCYSMTIGVPKVIFIYENRDTCNKKAYLVTVTDKMVERVVDIINRVNKAVQDNVIPPRCEDTHKCSYCKYKGQCKKDGI